MDGGQSHGPTDLLVWRAGWWLASGQLVLSTLKPCKVERREDIRGDQGCRLTDGLAIGLDLKGRVDLRQ